MAANRFCTNCGAQHTEQAHFCTLCGWRCETPADAALAPARVAAATVLPCPWCGMAVTGTLGSCPHCGATLDARQALAVSGWEQLPGRKDMAKLQFGDSFCQIEGSYVPVADMSLAAGDSVYFTHHVLLWKDPRVTISAMPLLGGWKRMFAGLPLIMAQAQGPGHVALSVDAPGEMVALPLQAGLSVDVREHLFVTATSNVTYDWFDPGIWYHTVDRGEVENHYPVGMYMDRFSAPAAPGLLLLHAAGNVFVRELAPGQSILIKPAALIFKDPSVQMHLHYEETQAGTGLFGIVNLKRYMWVRLIGPGRVAVQSVFECQEGEAGNFGNMSYSTARRW